MQLIQETEQDLFDTARDIKHAENYDYAFNVRLRGRALLDRLVSLRLMLEEAYHGE